LSGSNEQPRHRGRFDATLDDSALLEVAGVILRYSSPDRPAAVNQRAFDLARAPAGHPDCPSARAITMRLNRRAKKKFSWGQIAELATNDERSATMTLAAAEREEPGEHLDKRHAYFALRFVAQRSGIAAPVRDQYAEERAKILAAARRRKDADTLAPLLPTVGQIERLFGGDWDAALVYAELVREKPKPVPPANVRGLPLAEATAHFVKANGWWPTGAALQTFCRDAGVRLQGGGRAEKVADIRAVASAMLVAGGVALPAESGPPKDAKTRTIKIPADGIAGAATREQEPQWNEAPCVEAVARWLRGLATSAKTTKEAYRAFQRGKPDFPAPSGFDRHGGYEAVKRKAKELNADDIPF
jgi:hypothetical protein